ncbi:MAG: hemolysin family protein [Clostridia bacterium]|nr:hemolysin family protein [Clostridia bacterium]
MSVPLYIVIIVILIFFSAMFSGAETMYFSHNKIRMKALAANGNKRAQRVIKMCDNPDKLITTILVGNNICNITATTLSGMMFLKIITENDGLAGTISTIVMTVIMLLFGEITPKTLFQKTADTAAMRFVDFMMFFYIILTPFSWLFGLWQKLLNRMTRNRGKTKITDDELMTYVEEAESGGSINEYESDLIRSAIEFDDQKVKEILTPRVDVDALPRGTDVETALRLFQESGHSRLPVYDGTIDNVVGILNVKDFYKSYLEGAKTIDAATSDKVIYSTPSMKISELMRILQKDKNHLAVVIDEFGGTHGIVSLEDILEELVGEIWDEHDKVVEYFKEIGDKKYEVDCSVSFSDFIDEFGLKIEEDAYDVTQLSGFIAEIMAKIPEEGDEVNFQNLAIKVTKCQHMKAITCEIEVLKSPEGDGGDEEEEDANDKLLKFLEK